MGKYTAVLLIITVILLILYFFGNNGNKRDALANTTPPSEVTKLGACAITGCNSHLCVEKDQANDIVTTCEFLPVYACYQNVGVCEWQIDDNACGWTQTDELKQCIVEVEKEDALNRSVYEAI